MDYIYSLHMVYFFNSIIKYLLDSPRTNEFELYSLVIYTNMLGLVKFIDVFDKPPADSLTSIVKIKP